MATLSEIRQSYPQYSDMSDQQLADALYKTHYSDMSRSDFNRAIGLSSPKASPTETPKPAAAPTPPPKPTGPIVSKSDGTVPTAASMQELATGRPVGTSIIGSQARGLVRAVAPTAGAVMGSEIGGSLGALAAPVTAGLSIPAGAIVGGGIGALLTSRAQDAALSMTPQGVKTALGQSDAQRQTDLQKHPYASLAGELLPGFLFGRPAANVGRVVAGGALGAGVEAGREQLFDRGVDPTKVFLAGAAGAAQSSPWRTSAILGAADSPLQASIRAKPVNPSPFVKAQSDLTAAGVVPTPFDVTPKTVRTDLVTRAVKKSPAAQDLIDKYVNDTTGDTNAVAKPPVQELIPAAPGRTPAQAVSEADATIAAPGVFPDVPNGSGGSAIHQRLNADYDARQAGVDQAYNKARETGDAFIQPLDSTAPDAPWTPASTDRAAEEGGPGYVHTLTNEFLPADKAGPKTVDNIAENVQKAVEDKGFDLGVFDELSSLKKVLPQIAEARTVEDLFKYRQKLSTLQQRGGTDMLKSAAGTAKSALDQQIYALQDAGRFGDEHGYTDTDPVQAWKEAVQARREFGNDFEGNNAIEDLTKREYINGKLQPAIDAPSASDLLLGGGKQISQKTNSVNDLTTIRDRMGVDSPEWQAFRQEALQRQIGADYGKPTFGKAYADFKARRPDLAAILITPADDAAVAAAQTAIGGAQASKSAVAAGMDFRSANPTDFAGQIAAAGTNLKALQDMQIAAREAIDSNLKTPEGAKGLLKDLTTNERAQANLKALFGADAVEKFTQSAQAILQRTQTAQEVGQAAGAPVPTDAGIAGAKAVARTGLLAHAPYLTPLVNLLSGKNIGMSEVEATQFAQDAMDPTKTQDAIDFMTKTYGQNAAQAFLGRVRAAAAKQGKTIFQIGRGIAGGVAGDDTDPDKAVPVPSDKEPVSADQVPQLFADAPSAVNKLGEDTALALTAAGEAGNSPEEMRAVIHTALNRQASPKYNNNLAGVLTPSNFNAWEDPIKLQKLIGTPKFDTAMNLVHQIRTGDLPDNTGGATYFYAPNAQAQLHRTNPSKYPHLVPPFAQGRQGMRIGTSVFYPPLPSDLPTRPNSEANPS